MALDQVPGGLVKYDIMDVTRREPSIRVSLSLVLQALIDHLGGGFARVVFIFAFLLLFVLLLLALLLVLMLVLVLVLPLVLLVLLLVLLLGLVLLLLVMLVLLLLKPCHLSIRREVLL